MRVFVIEKGLPIYSFSEHIPSLCDENIGKG